MFGEMWHRYAELGWRKDGSKILNYIWTLIYWFGNFFICVWHSYHVVSILLYSFPHSNKTLVTNYKARIFAFSSSYPLSPFINCIIRCVLTAVINNPHPQGLMQCRFISYSSHSPVQVRWEGEREKLFHVLSHSALSISQTSVFLWILCIWSSKQKTELGGLCKWFLGAMPTNGVHNFHWPQLNHLTPRRDLRKCAKAVCPGRKGDGVWGTQWSLRGTISLPEGCECAL